MDVLMGGSLRKRADEVACASQALYTYPTASDVVDSSVNTIVKWDKTCLDSGTNKIDIYLYAPTSAKANLPIHAWVEVPADKGSYDIKLKPAWWNVTTTLSQQTPLSLNIVKSGNEPWDSSNPVGPTFQALYTAPAPGKDPPSDAVQSSETKKLIQAFIQGGQLTGAGKTAAIVCPIIVVVVALGIFIRKLHINRNNKTADWADHMDKRMSRISLDWTSGGDGSAGPVPGSRPASYYNAQRPSGNFARPSANFARANADTRSVASTNFAGRGVGAARAIHGIDNVEPDFVDEHEMQARPRGQSMYDEGNRQSRISFANETAGDRVSRISFAPSSQQEHSFTRGHKNSASIPRVGQNGRQRSVYSAADPDAPAVPAVDPSYRMRDSAAYADATQDYDDAEELADDDVGGAHALGANDVQDRMRATSAMSNRESMADYPAVRMLNGEGGDEQMSTGMAPPSNLTSPDDAMKQYAAIRSGSAQGTHNRTGSSTAMRTLYTPQPGLGHRTHGSVTGSSLNEDDVVGYREANML
ncbi:hypothetical protein BDZ90DRAFT_231555 [Jaminaea rosea]|uniref:Uncharacterized protein n=1 Tax=Jaminaea rosea TaxID=1569628 RepID=A0A316UTJ0_9BASI|nr:hypothetical protein BDZ90DRAFT_231555 [Jaminaea rosea]PWN28572.1 hypothetical protein BDZ90DRAFT_231555 [Jaminaea rosea]